MQSNTTTADRLGTWASVACIIHCLLTPVLLSASTVFAHLLPSEESIHRSMAVIVAGLGTIALLHGFRAHRKRRVVLCMFSGFGLIAGTALYGNHLPSHPWEIGLTLSGSALMIAAHRMNHTFCSSCPCGDESNQHHP